MKTISDYTIYCTEEQIRKALELGVPIENHNYTFGNNETCAYLGKDYTKRPALDWFAQQPTAEQMIGFLRSKGFRFHFNDVTNFWRIICHLEIVACGWNENKELAAIDAAMEYLQNIKQ